jgi:hypothetical protein
MGSRKNPNTRNARLAQMQRLFKGYTREQAATDRADYLATGESPSEAHFIIRMDRARRDARVSALTDAYYRKEFYDEHRKQRWGVYLACREAADYRKAQGRDREREKPHNSKERASVYAEAAKQRLMTLFLSSSGDPQPWVKAIWEKVTSAYAYASATSNDRSESSYLRLDKQGDYLSLSLGIPAIHAYRIVKGDPRYCMTTADENAHSVLWIGKTLPHGRQEACALVLFEGMPHVAGGYIYRYKQEWRFKPQRMRCIISDTAYFGSGLGSKP